MGFSVPVIVPAIVGGKLEKLDVQTSITIEPAGSATKYQESILQENGIVKSPLIPVPITEDPPSMVIPKVFVSLKYDAVSAYEADTEGTGGAHEALRAYDADTIPVIPDPSPEKAEAVTACSTYTLENSGEDPDVAKFNQAILIL